MHFLHIKLNSLKWSNAKIKETRFKEKISKATVITETKLDGTVFDAKIYIEITAQYDVTETKKVNEFHKHDICFSIKNIISKNIEVILVDLLLPKTKPISIGVVYGPPKDTNFLQLFAEILNFINISKN